jgi:hypothetical protein
MRLLYWAKVQPSVFELLLQELRSHFRDEPVQVCLQISPQLKTNTLHGIPPDELLRCEISDLSAAEKWMMMKGGYSNCVVLDAWGLLFRKDFDAHLESLRQAAGFVNNWIVYAPALPHPSWRQHAFFQTDERLIPVFATLFQRLQRLHEVFMNALNQVRLLAAPPVIKFLGASSGSESFFPVKRLGMSFLPVEFRKHPGYFLDARDLAKETVSNLIELRDQEIKVSKLTWLKNIEAKSQFPDLSNSEQEEAFKRNGFLKRLKNASCTWESYLGMQKAERPPHFETFVENGVKVDFTDMLRWGYFQGVMQGSLEELERISAQEATNFFSTSTLPEAHTPEA